MSEVDLRAKLAGEVQAIDAATLLPHHRRGALVAVAAATDILDVAEAVARDDLATIERLLAEGAIFKPSIGQMADWCVDTELRFQFVIVQPYVLAQPIGKAPAAQASN